MSKESRRRRMVEFFRKEYQKFLNYVRQSIDDAAERDAEDIVQDVVVNIFERADVTIPIDNLSAYIYRSLKNRIIDVLRKKRNDLSLDAPVSNNSAHTLKELLRETGYDMVSELEKNELQTHLVSVIESLDPKEQAVIIETEFRGCSFRELSDKWDIPIGTLLSRKSRALKKIKDGLINFLN